MQEDLGSILTSKKLLKAIEKRKGNVHFISFLHHLLSDQQSSLVDFEYKHCI